MAKYSVYVNVRISQDGYGGGMEIREDATIEADTFLEIASILGEFHKLSQTLKKAKAPVRG